MDSKNKLDKASIPEHKLLKKQQQKEKKKQEKEIKPEGTKSENKVIENKKQTVEKPVTIAPPLKGEAKEKPHSVKPKKKVFALTSYDDYIVIYSLTDRMIISRLGLPMQIHILSRLIFSLQPRKTKKRKLLLNTLLSCFRRME